MSWTRLSRFAAPSAVMTLAEAKEWLRVDDTAEDGVIQSLIEAATAKFDGPKGIGVAVMQQTWNLTLDEFPACDIEIPLGPVTAITHIKYFDLTGTLQTLDSSNYRTNLGASPAMIEPVLYWPGTFLRRGAVEVRFVAGAATSEDVPADLMQMIRMMLAHLYRNREAAGPAASETPLAVSDFIARHMVGRFS